MTRAQQWTETNAMGAGEFPGVTYPNEIQVTCFASIGTNLFAGGILNGTYGIYGWDSLGGGVYLSTDNGVTWTNTNLPSKYSVYAIFADGASLYAGTFAGGIWRTTDNGVSWSQGTGIPAIDGQGFYTEPLVITSVAAVGPNLFASACDANDDNGTLMGKSNGVYLSTDNGSTWSLVNNGLLSGEINALGVMGTNLFAGDLQGRVSLTTDNGANWSPVSKLTLFTDGPITGFTVMGPYLFASLAGGNQGGNSNGVFRSSDSGKSWSIENNGLTAYGGSSIRFSSLAVHCSDIYNGTNNDVFRSTDSGASWTVIDSGFPFLSFYGSDLLLYVDGDYLYATQLYSTYDSSGIWRMQLLPVNLSLTLHSSQLSSKNQELDTIPVYASCLPSLTGGSVTFRIDMRTDLLTPESVTSPIPGATFSPLQIDSAGAWITVMLPSNFTVSSDTLIANVVCRAYVTDTNATAISLAGTAISNSSTDCLSINATGGISFTLTPECGDSELTEFLRTGSLPSINIVPNPATSFITIKGSVGPLAITDALGRNYDVPRSPNTLDISSLPSGVYFVSDGHSRAKFVKE